MVVDRRASYKVIKKMPGAKGSVRDAALCQLPAGPNGEEQEMLFTCGCDRYVRIYDPLERMQHLTQIGSIYLKQRLNTLVLL
mmetsp:Transcript_16026/g.24874  ORF Transcript_16026/g.24874 Transcript_16026/m.24874 type:complete len:82 (-) Transcript_16026:11-256(-)